MNFKRCNSTQGTWKSAQSKQRVSFARVTLAKETRKKRAQALRVFSWKPLVLLLEFKFVIVGKCEPGAREGQGGAEAECNSH